MTSTRTPTARRDDFAVTGQRITWLCHACHEPIRKGSGYLEADTRAAVDLTQARRKVMQKASPHVDLGAFMSLPSAVPWLPHHRACDPRPGCPDPARCRR